MAACTSRAAASMLRLRSNCKVIVVEPSVLELGHLGDPGDTPELPFQRRGHRRGHGLAGCAGQAGVDTEWWETPPAAAATPAARYANIPASAIASVSSVVPTGGE